MLSDTTPWALTFFFEVRKLRWNLPLERLSWSICWRMSLLFRVGDLSRLLLLPKVCIRWGLAFGSSMMTSFSSWREDFLIRCFGFFGFWTAVAAWKVLASGFILSLFLLAGVCSSKAESSSVIIEFVCSLIWLTEALSPTFSSKELALFIDISLFRSAFSCLGSSLILTYFLERLDIYVRYCRSCAWGVFRIPPAVVCPPLDYSACSSASLSCLFLNLVLRKATFYEIICASDLSWWRVSKSRYNRKWSKRVLVAFRLTLGSVMRSVEVLRDFEKLACLAVLDSFTRISFELITAYCFPRVALIGLDSLDFGLLMSLLLTWGLVFGRIEPLLPTELYLTESWISSPATIIDGGSEAVLLSWFEFWWLITSDEWSLFS